MRKAIDLTGKRFGRLTAMRRVAADEIKGYAIWECRCDCGRICEVRSQHLRSGAVKSCGCLLYNAEDDMFCKFNECVICKEKDKCIRCGWNPDAKRQRMV